MTDKLKAAKEERAGLVTDMDNILTKAETEKRELTPDEEADFNTKDERATSLEGTIQKLEKQEERKAQIAKDKAEEERKAAAIAGAADDKPSESEQRSKAELLGKWDFGKAFRGYFENGDLKLEGAEAEMQQEARDEFRGSNTSIKGLAVPSWAMEQRTDVDQTTSGIQPTVVASYVDAIREGSVHEKVGMNIIRGLTADYKIPVVTKQSLAWATAENSAAADGGQNFAKDTLTPVRLTGYVDVSNRLLLQNGEGAMRALMADLGRETGNKIDAALFSTANVTNAIPAIAATSGVGTFTEATYSANVSILADLIDAEVTLADAEGLQGNLAYVAATNLLADLKKSAQVSSIIPAQTNQIKNQAMVNGYPIHYTVANTKSAGTSGDFIFGDFSKVYLGFFGGMDIVVDPYSVLLNDQKRVVVHRHLDSSLVQGAAMVKGTSLVA